MRELEVNRRFAPEIYEEVLPVIRDDRGQLRIGGNSTDFEPLDWLVVMRRSDKMGFWRTCAATASSRKIFATDRRQCRPFPRQGGN